jgi:5-deoxy-glucuronate isomerase
MNEEHLTMARGGLLPGYNALLDHRDDTVVGLDFGVLRLCSGERWDGGDGGDLERAALVLCGEGTIDLEGAGELAFARKSFVNESPASAHAPAGARLAVRATTDCEIALVAAKNGAHFAPRLIPPADVENEHRGKGILNDTAYRIVRCVFDRRTAPKEARLVLGEVVTLPGRWSSYPPHHHPQPEIYYYRFSPKHGYGHGEVGENVYYLRDHDLLRITGSKDHGQVAAPGYHMYYLWAIRHLDDRPYTGFEYHPDHAGLMGEQGKRK